MAILSRYRRCIVAIPNLIRTEHPTVHVTKNVGVKKNTRDKNLRIQIGRETKNVTDTKSVLVTKIISDTTNERET